MMQDLVVAVEAVVPASRIMRSLRSSLPPVILSAILMLAVAGDAGAQSASLQGYLLWTRSDSGQAVLWQVDPVSGVLVKSIAVGPSTGIGASWKATSIQYVGASAYVLWTRSDTGQAELWTIDPATGSKLKSASLQTEVGIGGPWQATSYYHVSSTEGYVLWSRSATGRASIWRIDPSKLETLSVIPAETTAYLYSESGVGAPWEATSYHHVSATEGYVLWTRSDIGKAALWQIDPSLPTGPSQLKRAVVLYSHSGVGAPWQAASYSHMGATEGYVLWTRSDSGKTTQWQVDPSLPTGQGQLKRSLTLNSASGMSAPWQATSYMHRILTGGVILNGSSDPAVDIGRDGDFFLNTTTTMLFGPKTADGWGTGALLMGPAGDTGNVGPQGPEGPQGPSGPQGATGLPGTDGTTVLSGTADPAPAVGNNGDFFINTATASIFGPKTAGDWGTGTALVGPQGVQGIAGPTGTQGLKGERGPSVKVLDVDGNPVCNLSTYLPSASGWVYCFIPGAERFIRFQNVEEVGNVYLDIPILRFISTDCQGQPYVENASDAKYQASLEPFTGKWYTALSQTAQKQFLSIGSVRGWTDGQCYPTGTTEKNWYLPVGEVAMPFATPIRGPVQFVSQ